MKLKRHYDFAAPREVWRPRPATDHRQVPLRAAHGAVIPHSLDHDPPVTRVEVLSAPVRQMLSPRFIAQALAAGWLEVNEPPEVGDVITIKTDGDPLRYRIERGVGRYCCHCGEKLPDDDSAPRPGAMARRHVAENHGDTPSPDPSHTAGYCRLGGYDCVRL